MMKKGSLPIRLCRLITLGLLACAGLIAPALHAQGLAASFNTAADIPITAASYTAAGEATFALGFAPTPGTNLTVVKNTGLPFITGQFSNLANGATVNLTHNGTTYPFVVWYYGGEGNNDLVLLCPYTGLASWGYNNSGQLGDNSLTDRTVPVCVEQSRVLAGKTIVQVAQGFRYNLALCTDGTVAAWGSNDWGQFGDNSVTSRREPVAVNVEPGTSVLADKRVVAISAGGVHSLALCSDGTVAAWGYNFSGQLGNNVTSNRHVPVAVNVEEGRSALFGKTVVAIAAGDSHSLALCSDGTVAAWGNNAYGQLGNDGTTNRLVPVAVNVQEEKSALFGKTVLAIAAGSNYSLALCSDGTVATWGYNASGQLGDDSTTNRLVPVAVNVANGRSALAGKTVVAAKASYNHSLVLCSDGTVAAWGNNADGQLGDNNTTDRLVPVAVNMAAGTSALAGKTVVSIATDHRHSLALCSDGTVAAWGNNFYGQLGDNSTTDRLVPVAVNVSNGTSVLAGKQVSRLSMGIGSSHSIAIYSLMAPPAPEITVTGNDMEITQGDTTPSSTDFTDFGSVLLPLPHSQVKSQAFSISNSGNVTLHLPDYPLVRLSGSGAAAFTVTLTPVSTVLAESSSRFKIAFDPKLPGLYTAIVTISSNATNHPDFSFSIRGFGALSTLRTQAITFAPPTTVYLGQNPLSLSAYANSALPVTLTLVPAGSTAAGASIMGDSLSFTGTGTVKVQAVQAGGGFYAAAPTVVKTITVKANPTTLTLINLAQTYTGTPRAVGTLGGTGAVVIEYKIGAAFGSTAPTNAGRYSVRATDSKGTKTSMLVIAKAPLYVTPVDQRKYAGQDNPFLYPRYSGIMNGETAGVMTTAPVLKTTATKTSIGGVYPITASGGVSANYVFIYQQGALVVESFAGSYEVLMTRMTYSYYPSSKLTITITATNTSFTGKLYSADEATALSLKGTLVSNLSTDSATGSAVLASNFVPYPYDLSITINRDGSLSASEDSFYTSSGTGRRLLTLAAGKTATYAGAHTAVLEPVIQYPYSYVPAGAGWATAAISTKGVMTLVGRLGDGTSFTSSLLPDDGGDPTYRLFLQPYKTGASIRPYSYIGGALTLLPHPALANRRYVEAAVMSWAKAVLETDPTYPVGFGPVNTILMLDPWLPPATGFTLANRLGLTNSSFQLLHSDTSSALNGNLPTRVSLTSANAVTVTTPAANTTKWKATLVPTTGLFSGSFELADTTPKPRVVPFTGVLRQPAMAPDTLIGDGHYLLPPLTGTEKTTGEIMFLRP